MSATIVALEARIAELERRFARFLQQMSLQKSETPEPPCIEALGFAPCDEESSHFIDEPRQPSGTFVISAIQEHREVSGSTSRTVEQLCDVWRLTHTSRGLIVEVEVPIEAESSEDLAPARILLHRPMAILSSDDDEHEKSFPVIEFFANGGSGGTVRLSERNEAQQITLSTTTDGTRLLMQDCERESVVLATVTKGEAEIGCHNQADEFAVKLLTSVDSASIFAGETAKGGAALVISASTGQASAGFDNGNGKNVTIGASTNYRGILVEEPRVQASWP